MKGLDWLRAKTAAAVRIGDARPAETTPTDVQRVAPLVVTAIENRATPDEPVPTGFVRFEGVLTEAAVEQVRQKLQAAISSTPRLQLEPPTTCGCWPRYVGECRCGQRAGIGG